MTDASNLPLAALEQADAAALRRIWTHAKGAAPPRTFTARLMRLALAWEAQAAGAASETAQTRRAWRRVISARTDQNMASDAKVAPPMSTANGTRILKDWGGTTHEVVITADGGATWNGQSYSSLTAVARVMTGTNRNGPKFFGLRDRTRP